MTTQFRLLLQVHPGFVQRAAARLRVNAALSDITIVFDRFISATLHAASVSDIARVAEFDLLAESSFFLRVFLSLAHAPSPSPLLTLAAKRPRADDGERLLQLLPEDVLFLLPHTPAMVRDALETWRAIRRSAHPCQTFEVQLQQVGGNSLRNWIRMPFVAELVRQLRERAEYADSIGALLYREPMRGTHADVQLVLFSSPYSTDLLFPISLDSHLRPGLSRQRFKGLDKPASGAPAAAGDADELAAADDATADTSSSNPSSKKARIDAAGAAVTTDTHNPHENDDDDDEHSDQASRNATWSADEPPPRLQRAETILQHRTSSLIVVIDRAFDWHNINAIMRSCDALGVQNVWTISPLEGYKNFDGGTLTSNRRIVTVNKGTDKWLTVRSFD
jgi:hypothetical protein